MQNNIVVGFVSIMSMPIPVAGTQVYFHVASPHGIANAYFRIKEIGTSILVCQSCIYNFHFLPVGR